MRSRLAMLTMCLCSAVAGSAEAQKGKPAPQPAIVNWRCDVEMRDASGDAIKSDGGGRYTDGQDAFTCAMSPMESAQAGNPAPGSATFYFGRRPPRAFFVPARSGPDGSWAAAYDKGLQIRVFSLVDMPVGVAQYRAMAIPTSVIGALYADNRGGDDTVTDIVKVVRENECSWRVSFDAVADLQGNARMERYAMLDRKTYLGAPSMPLGYTLTTRAPAGSSISACPAVPVP